MSGSVILRPLTAFITFSSAICYIHILQFTWVIVYMSHLYSLTELLTTKYYSTMNTDLCFVVLKE